MERKFNTIEEAIEEIKNGSAEPVYNFKNIGG